MNKKSTILTIIITSIFTATITCTCIFIINNHNNNDFVEEITSNLSTAQIQREVETTNTTIESTKKKNIVETTTTTTKNTTTATTETITTTVTTVTTTNTTKPTTEINTEQTLKTFEKLDPELYDYFIHDNIFHDTKCQIALDLYRNGDSNSYGVGIDGFTSLPYTVDQMIEQGYIPCEKCIKR